VALDNKYMKYASSIFERTSLDIIEISVWSAAFAWKEDDEDDWGRALMEDELITAIRQKLIMSAKDMQRVGLRIHSTLAKMHEVLISKFLDIVDKAGDLDQRLNADVSKKVGSISVDEEIADRTVYTAKDPTAAHIGDLVTNPATFLFFGGAKATGKDSTSHWRTKIARVHQATAINGKLHADLVYHDNASYLSMLRKVLKFEVGNRGICKAFCLSTARTLLGRSELKSLFSRLGKIFDWTPFTGWDELSEEEMGDLLATLHCE